MLMADDNVAALLVGELFDSGHAKIPVDGHDGSRPADS
jgi:hypothetical protein